MSLPQEVLEGNLYNQIDEALDGFINESDNWFLEISSELFRTYVYPDGTEIKIDDPLFLSVSDSGGHRLFDLGGLSHYIVPGFVQIYWTARDGEPNFVS